MQINAKQLCSCCNWRVWAFGVIWLLSSRVGLPADILVICPAAWQEALGEWKTYREGQGWSVIVLAPEPTAELTRDRLLELVRSDGPPRFVLLAGDAAPVVDSTISTIPAFYRQSTAMVRFGGDEQIATDLPYADFDGDEVPDAALGRVPADSPEELRQYLQRVMDYEQSGDFSTWRRDVHVIAGVGGFGALTDGIIETATRQFLTQRVPGWSRMTVTHASLTSKFCPGPSRFCQCCMDRFNEGAAFWVYIGHGHVKTLDWIRAAENWYPILTSAHLPNLNSRHPPVAVFLACYTGAFDASEDALAERLVMQPGGAIAAISSTRVTGPYGLAMLSHGLLHGVYELHLPTIGEVLLHAKQQMLRSELAEADLPLPQRAQLEMIQAIADVMTPENYDLAAERQEHAWQVHLLGDPTLHLNHPEVVPLQVPRQVSPGDDLPVRCELPPGRLKLELAYRRADVRRDLDGIVTDWKTEAGRRGYGDRYQQSLKSELVVIEREWTGGTMEAVLAVPDELPRGKYAVRLFAAGNDRCWVGYQEVTVRPPRANHPASVPPGATSHVRTGTDATASRLEE